METQTISIKGMVCNRCVMTVKNALEELGHQSVEVSLGEASFSNGAVGYNPDELKNKLALLGFSLLVDKRNEMATSVKTIVREVYSGDFDFPDKFRLSGLLAARLGKDYDSISDAFIATHHQTIEQYMIEFRINRVKEFLVYSTLKLSDIAFKLNFNSVAHLSTHFKQQTGLRPSFFKEIKKEKSELALW